MTTLYKRITYSVIDEYGVDPLRDLALNIIDQVEDYIEYTVGMEAESNLPLIAYKHYGNKDLWWIITAYNGILDINDVSPGSVLRIPSSQQLSSLLTEAKQESLISKTGGTDF